MILDNLSRGEYYVGELYIVAFVIINMWRYCVANVAR